MTDSTEGATQPPRESPGTLRLEREEGAALVSASLVILFDLLKGGDRFPDQARPLFRAYMKLCSISNHKADLTILQAAMLTWERQQR